MYMHIQHHVSLRNYSTMRLGGSAAYLTHVTSTTEVEQAIHWAQQRKLAIVMIGSGSNIVWRDEGFNGLILVNQIMGFTEWQEDSKNHYITIGAGENWDNVVKRVTAKGLTGIEGLSLIPGTAGATPVQNVGAYGQEISQTLVSVEAYDLHTNQFVTIPNKDCKFSYRKSRFNGSDRGRFFITSITLHLLHQNPQPPFYQAVESYFKEHGAPSRITPQLMRDAVIAIRQSKLPDPAIIPNNGSFFGNPVVDSDVFARLQAVYGDLPHRITENGQIKLSAAWLIDQAGLKGFKDPETGMAIWPLQPLVFINETAQTTAQLIAFRQKIINAVKKKFGVTLEQEPELLP